jgi:CAAX protease family protein
MVGPQDPGAGVSPPSGWPLLAVVGVLVVVNLLNNVVAADLYLLWAGAGVLALALLAQADGLRPRQWGLGSPTRRAVAAALILASLIALVLVVGTRLPGISEAFDDERISGVRGGWVAFLALVRVPLGTAALEEVAFRGVLLAMLTRRIGSVWAVVASSVAFGCWHVVPSLGVARSNAAVGSLLGTHPVWASALAVLASGIVGVVLCGLRIRYDHLVVPWAVHATANSSAYLLAWLVAGS